MGFQYSDFTSPITRAPCSASFLIGFPASAGTGKDNLDNNSSVYGCLQFPQELIKPMRHRAQKASCYRPSSRAHLALLRLIQASHRGWGRPSPRCFNCNRADINGHLGNRGRGCFPFHHLGVVPGCRRCKAARLRPTPRERRCWLQILGWQSRFSPFPQPSPALHTTLRTSELLQISKRLAAKCDANRGLLLCPTRVRSRCPIKSSMPKASSTETGKSNP